MKRLIILLSCTTTCLGHGYLAALIINGKTYSGNVPGAQPTNSVIRQVSDISPVKGTSNMDINCGLSAQFAAEVADAQPGDALQFLWKGGGGQNWIHNTGPMLTYVTSCGGEDCTQYNSSSSKWFKIEQVARVSPGGAWAQLAVSQGEPANVTLPPQISPGNYLIRHEILGLQGAVSVGGAEFYVSCSQVKVGGSQTGGPTASELVTFPGAYSDTDPGIYDPNVYDPSAPYIFPGPPVAAFAGGDAANTSVSGDSGSGSSSGSGSTSSGDSGTSSSNSSPPSSPPSTCRLQRRTALATATSTFVVKTHAHRRRNLFTGLIRDLRLLYKGSD